LLPRADERSLIRLLLGPDLLLELEGLFLLGDLLTSGSLSGIRSQGRARHATSSRESATS